MNAPLALAVAATLVVAGVGPFLAVHVGGKMFDPGKLDEPATCTDDTIQIPRITDQDDRYSY